METNFTVSEGQQTRHEYAPSSDMTSAEGLQAQLANVLQPVLAKVQQQLTQTARSQIDAAFEPMHEAKLRQVDLLVASLRVALMGEVDRALDPVRAGWREHVERELLHPMQMALDEWIDRTLQPLFTGAGGKEAGHGTDGQESRKTPTDEGVSGNTHQELAQTESAVEAEGGGKKPGRRATSRKAAAPPKRPTPDQPPKPGSTARSSIGPATTRSSVGPPTTRSSVGKSTARSSVPPSTTGSSTRKSSRQKSVLDANSDARERGQQ
ncbi:MAG TPA: hypothetical protein VF510_17000 [Ktedonobacterales bacterium]